MSCAIYVPMQASSIQKKMPESFFPVGFKNEWRHLCPLNRIQIFQKLQCHVLKNEPLKVLKLPLWAEFMDRISHFSANGWWMSGDMRELRHLCGHLQPDFGEWVGVAPSMSLKNMTYFLQSSTLWQFATLLGPGKRAPPSSPKKSFFRDFPKGNLTLGGVRFPRGEPKWKIGLRSLVKIGF